MFQKLNTIADDTIRCSNKCTGVTNNQAAGIVPRGLILEPRSNSCQAALLYVHSDEIKIHGRLSNNCNCLAANDGCVIIGSNPGRSTEVERAHYINYIKSSSTGLSYNATLEYWPKIANIPYFARLRAFVNSFGIEGPILWSDLVKCECNINPEIARPSSLPAQTLRTCVHRYLQRELELPPIEWPIIAVGLVAFNALSSLVPPGRAIIGVPHPTGSFGHAAKLIKSSAKVHAAKAAIKNKQAIWL